MFNINYFTITFMGKTGVGKTSLINNILGLGWKTDSVEECTRIIQGAYVFDYSDDIVGLKKDNLLVLDTPGISACEDNDIIYQKLYNLALSSTNCLVWVMQANTRADRQDQEALERLIVPLYKKKSNFKVIICINRIDLLGGNYQDNWLDGVNEPSNELQGLIVRRKKQLRQILKEIDLDIPIEDFVECSVIKKYGFNNLRKKIFT